MFTPDKIHAYVADVCRQIRWKRAHSRVAEEMTNHILDGRASYMAQGIDESAATEKAIAEAGDAAIIGSRLDKIHRPKAQWGMFAATAALLLIGLLIRLFLFADGNGAGALPARLAWTGVGIAGMIAAYFADFTVVGKRPVAIYFCVIAVSVGLLLFSGSVNGRSFYAQYAVLLFPLAFSAIIFAAKNRGYFGIVLCGLAFALPGFIALCIPFVSGCVYFMAVGAALMGIAIYKRWFGTKRTRGFLLMIVPMAAAAIIFFAGMPPWQMARLESAFNPFAEPGSTGYMARELLDGAKFLGMGNLPGEYAGLTEGSAFYTDLLLTALISRFGWIAFIAVGGALFFFMAKGFRLCAKQKSSLGFFVSTAVMMTLCMQIVSYIAFNFGFQLAAPIALPLISHGNTAMVINLALIGFMLSVFRTGGHVTDAKTTPAGKRDPFFSWADGKLTIRFKSQ